MSDRYKIEGNKTYRIDEDGQAIPLANFEAMIVEEIRTIDGLKTDTVLRIQGLQAGIPTEKNPNPNPIKLPEVRIDANEFGGFQWVLRMWGTRAVIFTGANTKDELRTCIQLTSKPTISEIYGTMGWQQAKNGKKMFLHAGGAIKENGNDPSVTVSLPPELARFNLNDQEPGCEPEEAFLTSLKLIELGPLEVMWPLWAATYAPVIGPCDFAIHVAGRSGTFKSEIVSLFQSHYGGTLDARHLPASWSSTANALEAQAHFAANAIMVVDDFVPNGTSYQVKMLQTNADRLIRGQGNQAGRARLSDAASFKSAYYPRGLLLSTGEDTPEGHSVRARMLILEISPGDINVKTLTECQKKRTQLPVAMTAFISACCDSIAPNVGRNGLSLNTDLQNRNHELRDMLLEIGHSRTPPMLARLIITAEAVLLWAQENDFITEDQAAKLTEEAVNSITAAGSRQHLYLESADPVTILLQAIRACIAGNKAHLRSMSGGVPTSPDRLGWTAVNTTGEVTKHKANGATIGWIDWTDDTLYLEADLAFAAAKKEAGNDLSITKGTAWKRLKDAGHLKRTDAGRSRNTVRVTADGHTRNVLALSASEFFDSEETQDDDTEERTEDGSD